MTPAFFSFGRHRRHNSDTSAEESYFATDSSDTSAPTETDAPLSAHSGASHSASAISPASVPDAASAAGSAGSAGFSGSGKHSGLEVDPTDFSDGTDADDVVAPLSLDETLDIAIKSWRAELNALGEVASLDDVSFLDAAVIDLTDGHPTGLAQLYGGSTTRLRNLVRENASLSVAQRSFNALATRSHQLQRQFGQAAVHLALGVAEFSEQVGDGPVRTVNAPILLRPVRLSTDTAQSALTLDSSIAVNPVLVKALKAYGCKVDVETIARAAISPGGFTPRAVLTRIASLGREYLPGFEYHERLVVGAFVHPGQSLLADFEAVIPLLRTNPLIAAALGDDHARAALHVDLPPAIRADLDPDYERGIGDLDTSQAYAIEAVGTGAQLLLDAPPGVDVPATLAAILADAAASGRHVLHVPASGADGRAVAQVLRDAGLSDLVLDLTVDGAFRRHASASIRESMGVKVPEVDVEAIATTRAHLVSLRRRMQRYADALHKRRHPWNVSVYEALDELVELTSGDNHACTRARISSAGLANLDMQGLSNANKILTQAYDLGMLDKDRPANPWSQVPLNSAIMAERTVSKVHELATELLPLVREQISSAITQTELHRPLNLSQWHEQLAMLDGVRESLDVFVPEVFERSAADMVIATATKQWRRDKHVEMSGSDRRRFIKQARSLVRPGRQVEDLYSELVLVQRRREQWQRYSSEGGWPRLPLGLDEMERVAAQTEQMLSELAPLLEGPAEGMDLMEMPIMKLHSMLRELDTEEASAKDIPRINSIEQQLEHYGLTDLVADLAQRQVPKQHLEQELTYCWWSSILAHCLAEDPDMGGLDTTALANLASQLRQADINQVHTLAAPVAQAYAMRVRQEVGADKEQARALYRALGRSDNASLRDVLDTYPLAKIIKPIWIVPPSLVPSVLKPTTQVDLVIIDASYPLPLSQVVPALARSRQLVVVGDSHAVDNGVAGVLAPVLQHVQLSTTRHNLDPEIARFLAANGYADVIDVIPSPPGAQTLTLTAVDGRGTPAPGRNEVETVRAEVDAVVDHIIDAALTRPEQSLAVVALNSRHAEAIRAAVAAETNGSPALEEFFNADKSEPFVVVDISQAYRLRRDHIIIAVGYAKTPNGSLVHSFGQLSTRDGAGGLVAALCASRGTTTVVSCLSAADIDPSRLHGAGERLLRQLLERAQVGPLPLDDAGKAPDRLLLDLALHCFQMGLSVVPRYGTDGPGAIPLAVGHPDYPDELLVAVLTDDEAYMDEPSVRMRERYWVERLERRGWTVYRAFSAGVFVDPSAEAERICQLVLDIVDKRQSVSDDGEAVPELISDDGDSAAAGYGASGLAGAGSGAAGGLAGAGAGLGAGGLAGAGAGLGSRSGHTIGAGATGTGATGTGAAGERPVPPPPGLSSSAAGVSSAGQGASAASAHSAAAAGQGSAGANGADPGAVGTNAAGDGDGNARERDVRPPIAQGLPLQAYSDDQLDDLVSWIRSDGVERSEDEEVEQLRETLALKRRGTTVDAVLHHAVKRGRN